MNAPCPYEKVILSARCGCALAERFVLGERMAVSCRSPIAHHNCRTLYALLRTHARFALKAPSAEGSLPFGKQMRLMLGGLSGLKRLLASAAQSHTDAATAAPEPRATEVEDIHALVRRAQETYGALQDLPFPQIVRSIARRTYRRRAPQAQ